MIQSTSQQINSFILPFQSRDVNLENAGGKGASLARLACSGYPVPGGFVVATAAYRAFVAENGLGEAVARILEGGEGAKAGFEEASAEIRRRFDEGAMPSEIADAILAAYRALGAEAVAVRSSATAEDLPDLSFAGQQDTFLNVVSEAALLKAVVCCWSSLWTGRAIAYRQRQGIAQEGLALAVVVQQMVQSEVSGVLFTANPLSGLRSQVVIDACYGLGEALVSGQVEPDHYVVDTLTGTIVEKCIGAKAFVVRGRGEGGTSPVVQEASAAQALADEDILALARLGRKAAEDYGFPQDIEFAQAGGKLYLLQSRPITSLFPTPAALPAAPLEVLFSFAAVQGMLDPLTPAGCDFLRYVFTAGYRLFGYERTLENQSILYEAGERLWANFTPLMRNTTGRKAARGAMALVEPSVRQALDLIWDEPQLQPEKKGTSLNALWHMAHFFPRLAWNVLLNEIAPARRRAWITQNGENVLDLARRKAAAVSGTRQERLAQRLQLLPELAGEHLPRTLVLYISGVAGGMAPFNLLNNLALKLPQPNGADRPSFSDLALEITRGLPHNPTTEMDLALWEMAGAIRRDPASLQAFQAQNAAGLAQDYLSGRLPPAAQNAIGRFLERYGGRGLGEIDLGRPRWREDPSPVMQALVNFLEIKDPEQAPDAIFRRGAQRAEAAVDELAAELRQTRGGWLKARLARAEARRVREMMGMREAPKFFAVRLMGVIRGALLESGADFVQSGELDRRDDLMFLTLPELEALAQGQAAGLRARVAERRAAYERELRRRQVPRLLLSDGRAFYEGMAGKGGPASLTGAPVSPGVVEGAVRVIFDPRNAQLQPGEIMVCPGTDPSWTPLFLTAGGLVMEVGGMMTHGAVVAREYGIPAVVGVHEATSRLTTGQRIRVDGSSGRIDLL